MSNPKSPESIDPKVPSKPNWLDDLALDDESDPDESWDLDLFRKGKDDQESEDSLKDWDLSSPNDLLTPETNELSTPTLEPDSQTESDLPLDLLQEWHEEPDEDLDALVVLPWKTKGQLSDSNAETVLHLDPTLAQSIWSGPESTKPDNLLRTLRIQGIEFKVQFQWQNAPTERLTLGRDALTNRVLISIPPTP